MGIRALGFVAAMTLLPAGSTGVGQTAPHQPVHLFVLDIAGNGFQLTSIKGGVTFDIGGNGVRVPIAWTAAGADDSFVVLDVNKNGVIDGAPEVLGDGMRTAGSKRVDNVLDALLILQGLPTATGPLPPHANPDINADDEVFSRLRLWTDVNHDGRAQNTELKALGDAGVVTIRTTYQGKNAEDEFGNALRGRWSFTVRERGVETPRPMTAVLFAGQAK